MDPRIRAYSISPLFALIAFIISIALLILIIRFIIYAFPVLLVLGIALYIFRHQIYRMFIRFFLKKAMKGHSAAHSRSSYSNQRESDRIYDKKDTIDAEYEIK